jgi:hypothetical protein
MHRGRALAAFFLLAGLLANAGSSRAGVATAVPSGLAMPSEDIVLVQTNIAVRRCIVRECGDIYSNCVKRQSSRQSADWIRRHCQSQVAFCHGQCGKQFGGPPGGPPLRPPPGLRRPPEPTRYRNCYWDGTRPFCAGRCRPGFVRLNREGSGCISGSRVYCCEPMGSR